MMNVCLCPDPKQLREYASGDLDSDAIDRHLDSCPDCRRTLDTVGDGATSLGHWLRPVALELTVDEPLLAKLTARAKGLVLKGTIAPRRKACTSAELVKRLGESGLLAGEQADVPEHEPDEAGDVLAGVLVQRKLLTRYQADELLEDRGDGLVVGDYVLQEPIARGGMGWVFRGWHRGMKRVVAVKTVAPALSSSAEAAVRFQREVEAIARLSHRHIVAAYDAFETPSGRFLVMEHVVGNSLDRLIREEGPLPVDRAVQFVKQAAEGLAHAHAVGIIHRDVKPGNLLVDETNTVKVLDLGLARLSDPVTVADTKDITGGSVVMGTAAYMAPEQALDARQADARADIYALGCTLYFLVTGDAPYRGESVLATLLAHRDSPVPSLPGACPPALNELFRRMAAKRPEDRPGSMTEVVAELDRIERGVVARPARRRALAGVLLLAAAVLLALLLPHLLPTAASPDPKGALAPVPYEKEPIRRPQLDLVRIDAGRFFMGSDERDAMLDEKPRHEVRITRPFLLGKFEVTQEQFEEVMGSNPSTFSAKGESRDKVKGMDTKQHPVEAVSWESAIAFCNRLSEKHGLEAYYRVEKGVVTIKGGTGYRLPTEAEWEYACRAGSVSRWSHGNDVEGLDAHAWHARNSEDRTHPIGTKKPNSWGLHDMHGNVPEWCWDRYHEEYYKESEESNPSGSGKGTTRVYRGGGWNTRQAQVRSAVRGTLGQTYSRGTPVGLRVACNL